MLFQLASTKHFENTARSCRSVQNAVREDAWAECSIKKAEAAHINVGDERPGPILSKRTPRLGSARLSYLLSTELAEREVQSEITPRFNLQASDDHHGAPPRPNDVAFVELTSQCSR